MQYRRFISVVFLALIPTLVGCRSTAPGITPAQHSESAAEQSDHCRIAVRHYEAEDIPSREILKGFEQLARNNDARGTMWIARLYFLGRCSLPKRPDLAQNMAKEAIPEVIRLAENGDPEAQFLLGFSYQVGLAVDLDLQKAVNWYTKSVGGGQITAMNNLAVMLAIGHGT